MRVPLPREHGAYGQLLFPLVTALAIGRPALASLALALGLLAAFLAHEPLLILLGLRGSRAARERRKDAIVWLGALVIAAAVLAIAGVAGAAAVVRYSLAVPAALAAVVGFFILGGREHTISGEIAVAVALSSCGLPVALAARAAVDRAAICWLVFAVAFIVSIVAVHSLITRWRARGGLTWWWQAATLAVAVVVGAGLLSGTGRLPTAVPLALAPASAVALYVALVPPAPRHLTRVGWALAAASALGAVTLSIGLR